MPAPTSAAGAAEGGPPRTELQELQLKADQTTDEVSRGTRISVRTRVSRAIWRHRDSHEGSRGAETTAIALPLMEIKAPSFVPTTMKRSRSLPCSVLGDLRGNLETLARFRSVRWTVSAKTNSSFARNMQRLSNETGSRRLWRPERSFSNDVVTAKSKDRSHFWWSFQFTGREVISAINKLIALKRA